MDPRCVDRRARQFPAPQITDPLFAFHDPRAPPERRYFVGILEALQAPRASAYRDFARNDPFYAPVGRFFRATAVQPPSAKNLPSECRPQYRDPQSPRQAVDPVVFEALRVAPENPRLLRMRARETAVCATHIRAPMGKSRMLER